MTDPAVPGLTLEEIEKLAKRYDALAVAFELDIERRDADSGKCDYIVYGPGGDFCWVCEGATKRAAEKAKLIVAVFNTVPRLLAMAKRTAEAERQSKGFLDLYLQYVERSQGQEFRIAELEQALAQTTRRLAEQVERTAEAEVRRTDVELQLAFCLTAAGGAREGRSVSEVMCARIADLERRLAETKTKDAHREVEIERLARTVQEFQERLATAESV